MPRRTDEADRHRRAQELFETLLELPAQERTPLLEGLPEETLGELESLLGKLRRGDREPRERPTTNDGGEGLRDDAGGAPPEALGATRPLRRPMVTDPGDYHRTGGSLEEISVLDELRGDPERIGPYVLKEVLGQGGMGQVYLAEQREPLRRTVALKLIRSGFVDATATHRFRAERMALARMSHPNIAQVYEAGDTADGHPYLVMEYVPGEPITDYCDSRALTVEARLDLFTSMCRGIHHAHQKGILHRDIKPANVLVTEVQGEAQVKVIDFGIAKPLERSAGDSDLTAVGMVVGTPAYLSPESISAPDGAADTDIRSDVYALGVLLFELLAGERPFGREGDSFFTILEQITREELSPPSVRFKSRHPALQQQVAAARRTTPAALVRRLRGDLDGIVLQAMARKREERYGSVAELEADLDRHLSHQPVLARKPSQLYQMGKFVRRHRGAVAAALLLLATLVGGVVARTQEAERANRAAAAALQAEAEAREVVAFLVDLFEVSDPSEARGNTITARELLDRGAEEVRNRLEDQPLARARLAETIGTVYRKLGVMEPARPLLEEALELRLASLGEGHPDVATSLDELGQLLWEMGEYPEAEEALRQALHIREEAFGPWSLEVAEVLDRLGSVLVTQGRFAEAQPVHQRALAIREAEAGPDDLLVARTLDDIAVWHLDQGLFADAEPHARRALEIRERQLGLDHPEVSYSANTLAISLANQGESEEALELHRRTLEIRERILGPEHTDVAQSLNNIASVLIGVDRLDEAEPLLRRAVATYEAALGPGHRRVGIALFNLADLHVRRGEATEAEALLLRTLAIFEEVHGPGHLVVAFPLTSLAKLYEREGRLEEAEPLLGRALEIRRQGLEPGHDAITETAESHQRILRALGRLG
jgi:eukaryotic-like serine/threonine-protein kinase